MTVRPLDLGQCDFILSLKSCTTNYVHTNLPSTDTDLPNLDPPWLRTKSLAESLKIWCDGSPATAAWVAIKKMIKETTARTSIRKAQPWTLSPPRGTREAPPIIEPSKRKAQRHRKKATSNTVVNQPTHEYLIKEEEDLSLSSIVHERQWLEHNTDGRRYVWVRLGLIAESGEASSSEENSDTISDRPMTAPEDVEQSARKPDIEQRQVLVGWCFESDQEGLRLMSVPAWDFGEHWIGDCFNVWEYTDFNPNDEYLPQFAGANDLAQLHTKVKAYLVSRKSIGESGLPFMPKFTLEVFDPMYDQTGAPGEFAQVVFRLVTHFDLNYQGEDPAQLLPHGVQYKIDAEEGADEIKGILAHELRRHSKDTKLAGPLERTPLSRLFAEPFAGRWNLVLWVLAQNGGT